MKKIAVLSLICIFLSKNAIAARPMVTDDARLTKGGSCQLESWVRVNSNGSELWALPACNPSGNFEVTLGGALSKVDGQKFTTDIIVQAKTIIRELKTNDWAMGFAIGHANHQSDEYPGPNGVGSTYAYVPISISSFDDKLITHINVGYIHNRKSELDSGTWGVGAEVKTIPNLLYILEAYGDHRSSPYVQTGLRYSVVPDIFQIDTTVGQQLNTEDVNWLSIGLRYTPDNFLKKM